MTTPTTSTTTARVGFKPKLWVPGDWNAFFGFGTNILVNLMVLTTLLRFVIKMPDSLVFGRILPATGLMLCLSTMYYAYLAYKLAQKTGRKDVCALPSGISVPHMFVVTFVIMLPIALKTGDPVQGWEAGLTWVFIQSFVLMLGGFIGPIIRKITPRAALLGTLAGVSIAFISMRPAQEMFITPVIGFVCFSIILASWFGGVKYRGVPAGLVAIAVGSAIAWISAAAGWGFGGMGLAKLQASVSNFGFSLAHPGVRPHLPRLQVPGRHPDHRDSVRHLRPGRSARQRRERGGGGRQLPDHARADRRRRRQLDRLPDGHPVHQRRLHRPPGMEGDGWPHRLLGGDRRHGHRCCRGLASSP